MKKRIIILIKYILLFFLLLLLITFKNFEDKSFLNYKKNYYINNYNLYEKIKSDYYNNNFAIIKKICKVCGLFSFYLHYLGCIKSFIYLGYIPIIDLSSFPNIFNGFTPNKFINNNPWEFFFNQPFGYKLKDVLSKAKNIKYFECEKPYKSYPSGNIYINNVLMDYWHDLSIKYMPIKDEIIKQSVNIFKKLFKNSINILGILARGTDYIAIKPKHHPIPPTIEIMIKDIKKMNNNNNYDWYFLSTEDEIIKNKLINEFGYKLKFLKNKKIKYNYKSKKFLYMDKNINGNLNYMKIYLFNIIILSKCIDIISARTSGSMGIFILSNGFRNTKVYYLGTYR